MIEITVDITSISSGAVDCELERFPHPTASVNGWGSLAKISSSTSKVVDAEERGIIFFFD